MSKQHPNIDVILRETDLTYVLGCVKDARSCAIVGLSNVGKSCLLRTLESVHADYLGTQVDQFIFVYIDFNLMLELSEQGFYEAVLRATRDVLVRTGVEDTLSTQMEAFYRGVVESGHSLRVPLSFNDAIIALGEGLRRRIVFLFDEFDSPFATLDGRVFLNLRALKDRYGSGLCYVTATERPLNKVRSDTAASEFNELFAGRTHWLGMLEPDEAARLAEAYAVAQGKTLEPDQAAFVLEQSGGHPGLLQAATQVLLRVEVGAPQRLRQQGLTLARDALDSDSIVHSECLKLWEQMSEDERTALMRLVTLGPEQADQDQLMFLECKGILGRGARFVSPPEGGSVAPSHYESTLSTGELRIFGKLFERFTRRQRLIQEGAAKGILVDVDAGSAWVDGVRVPTLTDLEYRLLLLLYGRLDKICDKYQIVKSVWGESYIDQVDDARIEKLVSRLRAKLERDPSNPEYLITMRGRGYKLLSG